MAELTAIDRDCRALVRYLTGTQPGAYVLASYARRVASTDGGPVLEVDRALDAFARTGRVACRVADAYARRFRPVGPLRRRLTLAMAVLETAPETHRQVNAGSIGSPLVVFGRIGWHLVLSAIALVVGAVVFGPVHLLGRAGSTRADS